MKTGKPMAGRKHEVARCLAVIERHKHITFAAKGVKGVKGVKSVTLIDADRTPVGIKVWGRIDFLVRMGHVIEVTSKHNATTN